MIYISTGGFPEKKGSDIYKKLKENGFKNIEFSGGKFDNNLKKNIKNFKNVQFHNYFPPPKTPFVFNLSTTNKKLASKSIKFIKQNIRLSRLVGARYYSFHAGFRVDPKPNELGKTIKETKMINLDIAKINFFKRVKKLNSFAKKNKIKLLIENNVISKKNFKKFGENPLLMCDPKEIVNFFKSFKDKNVGLLFDVAHFKVSSNCLSFDIKKGYKKIKKFIYGYHLSDNDGKMDTNKKFNSNSWFWRDLNNNAKFFTIEVYNVSFKDYKKLLKIVEKKIKYAPKY